ncbi:MAG TPA: TIR domain-containing protein, partial [Gemmatimonadaceae bacterium]|nr:TIR domain-containing protein [Gemmatimonadaceae bacterium]
KALRIPQAIADNYGKSPTKPLRVAQALNIMPSSSSFRMLSGAAIAYGIVDGGYNADMISITPLGKRIVSPTSEGDDLTARREALLRPRVIREFLSKYNNSRLPAEHIGRNVLEEMGVPTDRAAATLELILEGAHDVGFLRDVKGSTYVDLEATAAGAPWAELAVSEPGTSDVSSPPEDQGLPIPLAILSTTSTNNRVFITHGKNRDIVSQLKELLTFGSFVPVVSVDQETISKPVSDKVLDDMRSCAAAIIHVGTETQLLDSDGREHRILNPNVLIEIGAAMALYRGKFILLVERGVTLPSNLQGLYEVRYEGNRLEYESTMKLLKAFNDFRK